MSKKSSNFNELMKLVQSLSKNEQSILVDKVITMLNSSEMATKVDTCESLVRSHSEKKKPDCPHCGAEAELGLITKRGFKDGVQRYFCKQCGKSFVATTNTAFAHTRKKSDTWRKFIELTISGATLWECVDKCEIAYQTAFTWRHKILNVFKINQQNTMMSGQIQIDELLIPISYKGNHAKGFHSKGDYYSIAEKNMPRKAFKRGSDNKPKSSKDRACVFCMVQDGNKNFFAAVPGTGFMTPKMLDCTIGRHVLKEKSLVIADQYKKTANYLSENNYNNMILAANTSDNAHEHKPEIRDGNHLQHVNSMHSHLRTFLAPYRGVSTKHLEGYVALFIWIKNATARKQKRKIQTISLTRASIADCYARRKDIEALPAVPTAA